ncbi:cation:proton antiporter [Nitrosomonas aestuarii]|uniref:cation:proton antiporter domain-containing protein n=1 Tax=Nitrosomonas aestuarii TaxID=52441 RepID=UPI000D4F061A|nr:cation:proton antiporter [Nitrosomonas aestuarii]PTN11205.1 sodium/hydrogen exchanger family protein [Nitrosomonas aestuarii]
MEEGLPDIFAEMALLLLLAVTIGALGVRLRQPLIVGFIAVGILAGPSALDWVSDSDQVDLLAKLGITLLLFVVGLKLDLHIIRTMGLVALATGLGHVAFTSIIGYLIALALGMSPITALYVAVALTFSSTIIIVKLHSDKRDAHAAWTHCPWLSDCAGSCGRACNDRSQCRGQCEYRWCFDGPRSLGCVN